MQSGMSVWSCSSRIICASSSASSTSGMPALTSSMSAPMAICASASSITRSRLPSRNSCANALRPVGLMRSPMMQNGLSIAIVTVLDRDCRTVSTRVSLLGWGNAEPLAQAPDRVVLAERDEVQPAHARLSEGVPCLFDCKFESFLAGIGGVLHALDHSCRHRDPRHLGVHDLERPRAGDEADREQERGALEQPDARPLGVERLEMVG